MLYAAQQREQNLRRDLEVVRKEKERLHVRVGHQRRELGALSRCYWQLCRALEVRGRALSLLASFVRTMGEVSERELRQTAELDGGWPSELARAELERRKHWHFVGVGLLLTEMPRVPWETPTLEQTG
jgi:hypothetical protein